MHENLEIEKRLAGQRVLVTGSSGMLGQAIVPLLQKAGAKILSVDLRPCNGLRAEDSHLSACITDQVRMKEFIAAEEPTLLVNLAAECGTGAPVRIEDYTTNREGVELLCELVEQTDSIERWIHTSSQTVCKVGYQPELDDEFCPESVYGESKVYGEKMVRRKDGGQTPWCIVRPTTVWGPGINLDYLGSHFIYHIYKGTYFHVGEGALRKSYSFVGNIAWQYLQLLCAPSEQVNRRVFYLSDYDLLSIRDMANSLAKEMSVRKPFTMPLPLAKFLAKVGDLICLSGVNFPFQSKRLSNMRLEYIYDLSETEAVCGPLPYKFEDGIKMFSSWFLSEMKKREKHPGVVGG